MIQAQNEIRRLLYMKKLIAMILAAAMLLSLTACGSTAADAAADDPEAETCLLYTSRCV